MTAHGSATDTPIAPLPPVVDSSALAEHGLPCGGGGARALPMGGVGEAVICHGGDNFLLTLFSRRGTEAPTGMLAIGRGEHGLYLTFDAGGLRQLAANMLRAADMLDRGRGKN